MEGGGSVDLHSTWWSKDVGSSGVYLTLEFYENVFILVTIIQTLEHLQKEQNSQSSFDNIMGVALGIQIVITLAAYWFLNRKIGGKTVNGHK